MCSRIIHFNRPVRFQVQLNLDSKDLIIKTKRAGGPGGQHVNKTESAVQVFHTPTGMNNLS